PADSRDLIKPDPLKRGHTLRNRCGGRPRNYAPLHQRQWIESKLFERAAVPLPRIGNQRAVYGAGLLASRVEWDDLLRWRLRSHSNTYADGWHAYTDGYSEPNVHAEFVPCADSVCRYRWATQHVAKPDNGRTGCDRGGPVRRRRRHADAVAI